VARNREYEATLDKRKRITLRGAHYEHYHVIAREDGVFELHPRVLADPLVSARTLDMMDSAMANFARGQVSEPIDPDVIRDRAPSRSR
jgi:hypothetical protein